MWWQFFGRFRNPLVLILLAASVISAVTGDVSSFVIVITIVVLSVVMDFIQEQRAEYAIDALRAKVALRAQAIRDGSSAAVLVSQLVPGDIVELNAGDLVPADGRLLSAHDFFVNQALLTGEPYPVEKHAVDTIEVTENRDSIAENITLAGSSVISGEATLVICRTGRTSAVGKLAASLATKPPPTAFEVGLQKFSALILLITLLLVLFVLTESVMFHRAWLESLLFALALAVGLTPELLPMIVTVTLAHGAVRLARQRVIVKRLSAIHNLGAMDVLCTDKTGTLTEAHITLTRSIDPFGAASDRVLELAYLNSRFETGLRSPLDNAIIEERTIDIEGWRKLDEVSFDFIRRRVSVLVERGSERLLIVKGAPEDVINLSASYVAVDGVVQPMTASAHAEFCSRFERLGDEGLRALGIAYRAVSSEHETAVVSDETELMFAGFTVFVDPPKTSTAAAIAALAASGVAVKILTGDNERVAIHLCNQLGIPLLGTITGDQLAAMSDEALAGSLANVDLFSRVTPDQKLRVLLALKRTGRTVGYLGDGINDAPALRAADVGISVDSAVDVAKAAAEIVLLDKDLNVLHEGAVDGRRTVVNVNKYILMASSANFGNIVSMALAGLFLPFLPLLPIQVLLTNLIYDFAQTGLPFDEVDEEVIARPVHWNIRLIERFMPVMGPISTVFDLITFGVLIFLFQSDVALFRTGWFIESLVTQILMIFAIRTRRHIFASAPAFLVTVLALGTSILTLLLPFLPIGAWFEFVVPPVGYFCYLALAVAGFLIVTEWIKRFFYAHLAVRS